MTNEEAKKVAQLFASADYWCGVCGLGIAAAAMGRLPGHDWEALVREALEEREAA